MRHVILREGSPVWPGGPTIEVGATLWHIDKPVYVLENFDYSVNSMRGKATDIRRERNGEITAELQPVGDVYAHLFGKGAEFSSMCNKIEKDEREDGILIYRCQLQSISLLPRTTAFVGSNPEATKADVEIPYYGD